MACIDAQNASLVNLFVLWINGHTSEGAEPLDPQQFLLQRPKTKRKQLTEKDRKFAALAREALAEMET